MKLLLDTNIILYFLGGNLKEPLADNEYCVSVITQLELLSYPALDKEAESIIKTFLKQIEIIDINPAIVIETIQIRKKYKFKLPDSIILATALFLDVEILSNDNHFAKVSELKCKNLELISS